MGRRPLAGVVAIAACVTLAALTACRDGASGAPDGGAPAPADGGAAAAQVEPSAAAEAESDDAGGVTAPEDAAAPAAPFDFGKLDASPGPVGGVPLEIREVRPGDAGVAPASPPFGSGGPRPAFRRADVDTKALAEVLEAFPETRGVGGSVRFTSDGDAKAILDRGKGRKKLDGWEAASLPLLWAPREGVELLVVAGRGSRSSFVVLLERAEEGAVRPAAALVLYGDRLNPFVAREPRAPQELRWGTCWGCLGEFGAIRFGSGNRPVILPRE